MKIQDSEILRRSSLFRFVSDEHFEAIEPLLQEEHYEFGEVIVMAGAGDIDTLVQAVGEILKG